MLSDLERRTPLSKAFQKNCKVEYMLISENRLLHYLIKEKILAIF